MIATKPATTKATDAISFVQKNGIPTFLDFVTINVIRLAMLNSKNITRSAVFIKTPLSQRLKKILY